MPILCVDSKFSLTCDFHLVLDVASFVVPFLLEMGKKPNLAKTNRTSTQVLPRTEPNLNPKAKNIQAQT